ncbi:MAG: alpha/beta hydrolase [Acutalibacteraceae bacterium]|jgi:alpha-beta hydrolase superfamily lysophospholipase|nr:alpha/beta hydrolase [Acutalibacteraceae bacterium]
MKTQKFMLGDIPAILWGEDSNRVYVHVHGKMSRKEYAESFAAIAETKGYQTLSFDLPEHGERTDSKRCDVWDGVSDLRTISDYAFANWERVSLYACSIGAYFSLNAYNTMPFEKALFQSPIVDMEWLVKNMMLWSGVTEAELESKKEIPSPVDTLRWDYYQYIISHPITQWNIPTAILYGGKDNLQPEESVRAFAEKFGCSLTVSENSEHPFMAQSDAPIVENWLCRNI